MLLDYHDNDYKSTNLMQPSCQYKLDKESLKEIGRYFTKRDACLRATSRYGCHQRETNLKVMKMLHKLMERATKLDGLAHWALVFIPVKTWARLATALRL